MNAIVQKAHPFPWDICPHENQVLHAKGTCTNRTPLESVTQVSRLATHHVRKIRETFDDARDDSILLHFLPRPAVAAPRRRGARTLKGDRLRTLSVSMDEIWFWRRCGFGLVRWCGRIEDGEVC
jgi:hypothetical protein